mmetsp:Transcript_39508/g.92919  ORF Transcript_39508/g.92919 Transcript_39508/m.92919 type:complete len:229 (-) Transcript_39508:986-1672(-)
MIVVCKLMMVVILSCTLWSFPLLCRFLLGIASLSPSTLDLHLHSSMLLLQHLAAVTTSNFHEAVNFAEPHRLRHPDRLNRVRRAAPASSRLLINLILETSRLLPQAKLVTQSLHHLVQDSINAVCTSNWVPQFVNNLQGHHDGAAHCSEEDCLDCQDVALVQHCSRACSQNREGEQLQCTQSIQQYKVHCGQLPLCSPEPVAPRLAQVSHTVVDRGGDTHGSDVQDAL